jgi:FKBP-type peptidyl-prolyl cis-trans isomerase
VFATLFALCLIATIQHSLRAQGATQGTRGAAAGLQEKVQKQQQPLTTGPEDPREQVSPGKIDADASGEFKTTESGLKYRILRKSDKQKPTKASAVEVHYKGWLDNKQIFDSSYRRGKPLSFRLTQVIPGWTEGMQLIGQGGMIELEIPAELGYGPRGAGPIPPNSRLHFLVELLDIK